MFTISSIVLPRSIDGGGPGAVAVAGAVVDEGTVIVVGTVGDDVAVAAAALVFVPGAVTVPAGPEVVLAAGALRPNPAPPNKFPAGAAAAMIGHQPRLSIQEGY